MDLSSIAKELEDASIEEAWEWFWSLFKGDFSKNGIHAGDYQKLHAFLMEKYEKDPTESMKLVSNLDVSLELTISLGGSTEEDSTLKTLSKGSPETFRNSICIEVQEYK